MATPDYEGTEVQDLLQLPLNSGIIKQGNCLPTSVLKTANSSKNQLSVTILDFVQSSCSDNEDQKSFLSNLSTSGTDFAPVAPNSDDRRGSCNSQKDGYFMSLDPKGLLQDRSEGWENRYLMKEHRRAGATFQGKVYNFLERPSGWKCVLYHIAVYTELCLSGPTSFPNPPLKRLFTAMGSPPATEMVEERRDALRREKWRVLRNGGPF